MVLKKIKVLIVSYHFSNDGSVASHRIEGFVSSLVNNDIDVTVLTCKELSSADNVSNAKIIQITNPLLRFLNYLFSGSKESSASISSSKPSKLVNLLNNFRKKRGILFLGRMPDVSDIWYLAVKHYLKSVDNNWDVVVSSYAPYSNLLIGRHLKKRSSARLVVDYRDPWCQHHLFEGIGILRPIEKWLESKINASADLICTATPTLSASVDKKNVLTLTNGFSGAPNPNPAKDNDSDALVIVHTGSIYKHKQNIEPFFKALQNLVHRVNYPVKVYFAGNEHDYVMSMVYAFDLEHVVEHVGFETKDNCERLLKKAHVGISFDLNDDEFSGIIPVKLSSYIKYDLVIMQLCKIETCDARRYLEKLPKYIRCGYSSDEILLHLLRLNEIAKKATALDILNNYSQQNFNLPLINYVSTKPEHN